jgi:ABC-type multidrug transport system fused ATPase/permease subunit
MTAADFYNSTLLNLQDQLAKRQKRKSAFGVFRFGSIAALIAAFYFLYSFGWMYVLVANLLLVTLFIRLVILDLANKEAIAHIIELIRVNKDELLALDGQYYHFEDGQSLIPKEHFYAADLDILGHASLFQFINRTCSEMGSDQLATWLLKPAKTTDILKRQAAVTELVSKNHWRQKLQAYGGEKKVTYSTLHRLQEWMVAPTVFRQFKPWKWLRYVLPAIILLISALTWLDVLSMQFFYGSLLLFAIIAYQVNKYIAPIHEQLSKMVEELEGLGRSIDIIEQETFESPLLHELQGAYSTSQDKASLKLKSLKRILDRLDIRYNIVISFPLNIFLLWNLQQVLDLEKWKTENTESVNKWFDTLGVFEALHSFATLHFNHPQWVFPTLAPEHFSLHANQLGHPLISEVKRVNNYINIDQQGEIMLVTGSNMAGKSTYLRSIGVNIVLAMAGAPVCAENFSVSPVQLLSSMRIADNLEESTSTFYAELKKLKTVIDKVNKHEKVFVLLDEILRGTNSLDRHTGSVALVKQLIKQQAAAVLATHDVELAALQNEFPLNILNFHFDVQVNNEQLYFDYQLKPGVCTSMNASILMKQIGIEI